MCNIRTKTDLKEVTIYKLVLQSKRNGGYYSFFAGFPIKVGPVPIFRRRQVPVNLKGFNIYGRGQGLYNKNLRGRTSGFAAFQVAKTLADYDRNRNKKWGNVYNGNEGVIKILKIQLGGSIYEGTSASIADCISDFETVYAGSEILSIEEVSE